MVPRCSVSRSSIRLKGLELRLESSLPLAGQRFITLPATEVLVVPVLVLGLRILVAVDHLFRAIVSGIVLGE